jgi:hypothetical protein
MRMTARPAQRRVPPSGAVRGISSTSSTSSALEGLRRATPPCPPRRHANAAAPPASAPSRPRAAAPDAPEAAPAPAPGPSADDEPETVFYESAGAPAQLAFQVLLGASIIYLPLTIAALGRYAWTKIRITNRRLEIVNTSPLFKGTQQLSWSQVKEVRAAPRAFGAWGDVVLFLKGASGGTVELTGLERYKEVVDYINARVEEARRKELEGKLQEAGARAAGGGEAAV